MDDLGCFDAAGMGDASILVWVHLLLLVSTGVAEDENRIDCS